MYFQDSTGFVSLICLLVQCSLAWVFAVFFGVLSHGRPAWQRNFFFAFVGFAVALTAMSVRFVLPHVILFRGTSFADGQLVVRLLYGLYLAGKLLFAALFLWGAMAWRGRDLAIHAWLAPAVTMAGFGIGFAVRDVAAIVLVQAAVMVAVCCAVAVLLRPRGDLDRRNPGRSTVRLVVILMAVAASLYVLGALPEGVIPGAWREAFRSVLESNAILDLVLQVIMATGLIVAVMVDAYDEVVRTTEERDRLRGQVQRDDKLRVSATLIGGVAHEINNPLTAIIGYGEDLSSEDPAVRHHAIKVVREQAARCRSIVKRMSAIGRRRLLTTSTFRVVELVEQVVDGMRPQLTEHSVNVVCDVPPKLTLVADAAGFEQVLTNLLGNAIHVSEAGQNIEVCVEPTPEGAVMTVRDHGPGVPEAARSQVFEPFWTTKRPNHGTGLGLAVVDAIVHAHSGKVEVRDADGGGAVFRTVWPWRTASNPEPTVHVPRVPPKSKIGSEGRGRRILIIDDEQSVRLTIRRYVELEGWIVDEVESAEAGLAALVDGPRAYDAIICDIRMPGMSGAEFHAALAVRAPHLLPRVLFVTGDIASQDVAAFAEQPGVDILVKPFVFEELMQRLGEVLKRASAEARSASRT